LDIHAETNLSIQNSLKSPFKKHTINHRHIVIFGVLCLFIVVIQAQIRPKQLRKEIMQSQMPTKPRAKANKSKVKRQGLNQETQPLVATVNPLSNKGATMVYIENSETFTYNSANNPDVQVLKGNVRFRHDNALMYCDSAYFLEKNNSMNAYGHVRIVQGDTLFVYGDVLYYDGNTKLARLRHNVRLVNRKTTLVTDSLNYDRLANLS
jgi:lipopolysaccharide assembly outer membrane protein LptD (OstA)